MTATQAGPETQGLAPRREAGVVTFERMTAEQQQAARDVLGLLAQMVDHPPQRRKEPDDSFRFLPRIDPQRASRVVLIDGGRGSGKTTLLLSLIEAMNSNAQVGHEAEDPKLAALLAQRRIIPTHLIDLQPLPEGLSLLAHIVNQFNLIIEALEGPRAGPCSEQRAPWNLDADGELASRKAWKKLQRCVLMGWDSNVPQRRAQVDPEEYFHEQEQAVRDQLELPRCFAAFMDALEKDFKEKRPKGNVSWAALSDHVRVTRLDP